MQLSVQELANLLQGSVEGDPQISVTKPGKIEEGQPGEITFLGNEKYEPFIYTTQASVVLVSKDFKPRMPVKATLLRVDDVYQLANVLHDGAKTGRKPRPAYACPYIFNNCNNA